MAATDIAINTSVAGDSYLTDNVPEPEEPDYLDEMNVLEDLDITTALNDKVSKKKRIWKYSKYLVLYTYYIFSKSLSLIDLITDLILLRKAIQYKYIAFTIVLFLSILAPYIISYSSGVKLFLFRRTFDAFHGFEKWLMLLYILPTGIFYFIFLDLIDITFQLYRCLAYIFFNKTHDELKESEETLAEQIGMNRMNYEGFKRQKTVGQLFFETIPQVVLQTLLFYGLMKNFSNSQMAQIEPKELLISIIAAVVNSIAQIARLYWESTAVQESLLQYALNCILGRVGWVPFLHQCNVVDNEYKQDQNELFIDFSIKYNIPLATRCFGYRGTMEFDFSSVTVSHFIATLMMMSLKNDEDDDKELQVKNIKLSINFSSSLRFLSIHDIVLLLSVCSERSIDLPDIDVLIDWKQAILFSIKHGKDISNVTNARLEKEPILNIIYKSGYDANKRMLTALLKYSDIDVNLQNEGGESIIHLFIKNQDYRGLLLIFKYCELKNINVYMNYHDVKGYSPLYLALNQYHDEVKMREKYKEKMKHATKVKYRKYLYEMLILYGNAHSDFPLNADGLSALAFALVNLKDFALALKLCNDYKARLQSYEITILPSLFLQLVKREDIDEIQTNRNLDVILNICQQCYIDLDGIKDEYGNNPLHFLINNAGWSRKDSTKKAFLRLLKYLLPLKDNHWLQQKNHDEPESLYPVSLAFSLNAFQIDTIQCLLEYDASIKQFCMDHHMESIINSTQDLATFCIQFEQENEAKEENLANHYMPKLKAVFDIFYMNDDGDDMLQNELIDSCLELQLVQQMEYLCNEWKCNITATQQQKLEELKQQPQIRKKLYIPRQKREEMKQQKQKEIEDEHGDDAKYENDDKIMQKPAVKEALSVESDIEFEAHSSNDMIKTIKTVILDDDVTKKEETSATSAKRKRVNWIELVYGLIVESLSSLDLITDAIVLVELYGSRHVNWTTFMVFATVCPYLVSYSVLITLFQKKTSNKNVSKFIRFLVGIFFMTPVCIIYFLLIDVSFMIYVILSTLFFILSCGFIDIKDFIDDYIFKKMFGLSRMQIIGYRRLRTLSQLTFETLPQIFLQLRILQQSQTEVTGVSTNNLIVSIIIAIFHLLFEGIIIHLDSRACYLSFYHYSIICLGARLNWIPYSHLFDAIHNIAKNDSHKAQDAKRQRKISVSAKMINMKIYDYEHIQSTTCGFPYNVDYIFTNQSLRNLAEQLTHLPRYIPEKWKISKQYMNKRDALWTIKLGAHCTKDVDLFAMADLFRACNGRINIDASSVNWYDIIFTNTDIRYLSYSPANLSAITKAFLECGDFNVTTYLLDHRMGGHYNVNYVKAVMIRKGVLFALRKFYSGLILFGLDKSSRNFIFYIMYYRLKSALSLNDKSYLKSAFMMLWYSSRGIFHDNTYLRADERDEHNVLFHFDEIQENEDDNDFVMELDNVEAGYDANEQGNVDFNFQVAAVEINSINQKKDSMKRFFSQTIKRYFENKKFELIINDSSVDNALKMSFKLAECFMCFHDQIELFLLKLFDDIIEQTNGNNINTKTKFKKDNNIYVLTYYDDLVLNEKEQKMKDLYDTMYGGSDEDDKYWQPSANIITQKHIDLLEHIISTPIKALKLNEDQYKMLQSMDVLLRTRWKMYHEYDKYVHLMQAHYDLFRPKKEEMDMVHIRPDENRVIFDMQLPTNIGLESVRITFEDVMIKHEDDEKHEKDDTNKTVGIIYLDISPHWALIKQQGMIHPKHYDTIRWNKIILHKFTKQHLMRNETPIIDLPTNDKEELFQFNPSISEMSLKMELSAAANEHIMCNSVQVALSYFITYYEQPYHEEMFMYSYGPHNLQRVNTTLAPVMKQKNDNKLQSNKCCARSSKSTLSDAQMERDLKRRVIQSKKEQRNKKVIIFLGLPNSGKQTFLKNMNCIHGVGYTQYDRIQFKNIIFRSVARNIVTLIKGIKQLNENEDEHYISSVTDDEQQAMNYILQKQKQEDVDLEDEVYVNCIQMLWESVVIQYVYNNRTSIMNASVDDNCAYFLQDIQRLADKDYVASDADILLVRNRNIDDETRKIEFDTRGQLFSLINPGNDRRKWIHYFHDMTAVIFLASLSCYDESNDDEPDINVMHEAIELFEEIVNGRYFQGTSTLLFLNKKDLFAEKIQIIPLSICFQDYDGQDSYDESAQFIKDQFIRRNHSSNKSIYCHITCATDKSNVERVFSDVTHIVVNQSLMRSGLT